MLRRTSKAFQNQLASKHLPRSPMRKLLKHEFFVGLLGRIYTTSRSLLLAEASPALLPTSLHNAVITLKRIPARQTTVHTILVP